MIRKRENFCLKNKKNYLRGLRERRNGREKERERERERERWGLNE